MSQDLLVTGIGHLTTNAGDPVRDAAVAISNGRVVYAGGVSDAPEQGSATRIDADGRAVVPGFVDAHTHCVFAGDRADEFALRMSGASYEEIAERGGGILATVRSTRESTADDLFASASRRVWRMIRSGTTAVEIKSGYGLDHETEARMLETARRIGDELPVTVRTTFLGAHAVPPEFADDRDGYLDLVAGMVSNLSGLADFCDVFVERGVFSVDEAREIFRVAAVHGLGARVHADQLSHSGGARLAAEIKAVTADHLDHIEPEDAEMMAEAGVVAVLAPGASHMMRAPQAPGPMLLAKGCVVALSTDCNPGTSFFEGMGSVISLAVVDMGLTPEQAIWSATKGGAIAMQLDDHGSLGPGDLADLVILDAPTPTHIPYRPATSLVWMTIKGGTIVHQAAI